MDPMPPECQQIANDIQDDKAERADLQAELKFATSGSQKASLGTHIQALTKRIAKNEAALDRCMSEPVSPVSNLAIAGIESTQAIQFFRPPVSAAPPFGSCPANRLGVQPENDIKLVAGKTTILRVYVDTTADPAAPMVSQLSGVLETRPVGSSTGHLPLTPYNAPVAPRLSAAIDRKIANHTLNFRMPPERCQGALEAKVTVFDSAHPGETAFTSKTDTRTLQFADFGRLEIRLVRIRYQNADRGMDIPAPTLADFWTTAQYVLKTYPTPGISIIRDSEALYDGDFTDISPGGNTPGSGNWGTTGSLYHILNPLVATEGLGPCVYYLALIPGQANQSGNSGWAVGQTAIANALEGPTLAQELAHLCGRSHSPCGNPPGPDPCYPIYGSSPSASIGEIGFDYVTSQVFDPANTRDFMSYCSSTWVSPYTYEALMRCCWSAPSPRRAGASPPEFELKPIELLHLHFTKFRDDTIVPRLPSFHIEGFAPEVSGQSTPYFVELHNNEGRILEAKRLYNEDFHTSLDDAYVDFSIVLPWQAEAGRVVFKRERQEIYSLDIEETAPEVELNAPYGGRTVTGQQAISWTTEEPATYIVRYSQDGGKTWRGVATEITDNELTLDFDDLPGGGTCMIQVLASAGFRTGKATSDAFTVARKPREPSIIAPGKEASVVQGESVHLFGFAHSSEGSAEPEALTWSSNIDGFLGSGAEAVVHTLSVARHRITLSTDDGRGDEASTSVNLTVRPREYQ